MAFGKRKTEEQKAPKVTVETPSTELEKFKMLFALGKSLDKKFDTTNSLLRLGSKNVVPIPVISTELPTFDFGALECGGIPRGRIVEVFGPASAGKTSISLHVVAQEQTQGGIAAVVDIEHALDPQYAQQLGVDIDKLIISQPDSGEQALQIVEELIDSKCVSLIVVDSVAALVPEAELAGEMSDQNVGLQARLMSRACRKLTAKCATNNVTLLFINQIRMSIGVMYGCFNYNARVLLANGTTEKIGKIVNQRLPVTVKSLDPYTGEVSNKSVINWFNNGPADSFLQITAEKAGGNGVSQMGVTENHLIITEEGTIRAGKLKVGDTVLGLTKDTLSTLQRKAAIGSILGDGSLRVFSKYNVSLRICHGPKQIEYCKWKEGLFANVVGWSGKNIKGGWSFDLSPSSDLYKLREESYAVGGRKISKTLLEELDPLAVAIWYMDDGSFSGSFNKWGKGKAEISAKSYTEYELNLLADKLSRLGLGKPTVKRGILTWSGDRTWKLHLGIAQYIHPSMAYKLHPHLRGQFVPPQNEWAEEKHRTIPVKVLDIHTKPKTESMNKYDLQIAENSTYFIDGIAVHNSPEVVTGGKALGFYASVRVDVRRKEAITLGNKENIIGHQVQLKCVKNKCGRPFRAAVVDLIYPGTERPAGFDKISSLIEYASRRGLFEMSGSWFSFNGEKLANGLANLKETLRDRDDVIKTLRTKIATLEKEDGLPEIVMEQI